MDGLLLGMPNEILLLILHNLATIQDVSHLSQTCWRLYSVFTSSKNRINILRSAAGVPRKPEYHLDEAFSEVVRIPPLNWALPDGRPEAHLIIDVNYGLVSEEMIASGMWHLSAILGRPGQRTFQQALHQFLAQFQELDQRWHRQFEHITEDILSAAAGLQMDLLRRSTSTTVDLSTENTIIALTFNCLLILNGIHLITIYTDEGEVEWMLDNASPAVLLDSGYESDSILPTITIHKQSERERRELHGPKKNPKPGFHLDSDLETMLAYIAQLSFQLLNTQDPRHWPTVLYVLLIFVFIHMNLSSSQSWMEEICQASESLEPLFRDLARYYYVCTNGGQILSNRWDEEDYARRVGYDQVAVGHALLLNSLWLDSAPGDWETREEWRGIDGFPEKLYYFAHGCAV
ncbi:hypothetical protein BDW59DRAFT_161818 [Aspergillus cavernicola]|uniref:F-box domain-containing protein n=1 Tax=Aspergillus cavernicola TaxID=176166 RepID=A0ABR4IEK6_9EURO